MESAENTNNAIKKFLIFIKDLIKGIFYLFGEGFIDLRKFFKKYWQKDKNRVNRVSVITTSLLIGFYLIYGAVGLYKDFTKRLHKDYYEEVLFTEYENEVKTFFDKYNERYKAKDCDFMREVGADEAMYDKYGRTSYGSDYSCEGFIYYPIKILIPIKIEPIEKTDNKYRVKGELISVMKNYDGKYIIDMYEFSLRKLLNRNIRHMTGDPKGIGPTKIDFKKFGE